MIKNQNTRTNTCTHTLPTVLHTSASSADGISGDAVWMMGCASLAGEVTVTWADDTGVFSRTAVTDVPVGMGTLSQKTLSSCTVHTIQQKLAFPCPQVDLHQGCQGMPTTQLLAYHLGFMCVPVVITDPVPLAVVENLPTSRTFACPIHQLQLQPVFQKKKTLHVRRRDTFCINPFVELFNKDLLNTCWIPVDGPVATMIHRPDLVFPSPKFRV